MQALVLIALLSFAYGAYATVKTHRIVGYWDTWNPRPTASQASAYTHIYFAFLAKSSSASGCGGWQTSWSQSDVTFFKNLGKTVIVSAGGGDMNWNGCTWNQTALEITKIVKQYGFDGADIDYEIEPAVESWIEGVTKDLRAAFNANGLSGKIITHVPQPPDLLSSQSYFKGLAAVKSDIDFIVVQYYNNDPLPTTNPSGAVQHYTNLVNQLFGGDASKVVFAVCLTDCPGWGDISVSQLTSITQTLTKKFPSFGGMGIWATGADDSKSNQWSKAIAGVFKSASLIEMRGTEPNALQPSQ